MNTHSPADRVLLDALFREKVRRARERPMAQKILDGARLFDENSRLMRGANRSQFPEFSDEQVEQEFRRRLAIARRLDDAGIYVDAEPMEK